MAELSVIEKNGVEYALKDKTAREAIEKIQQNGTGDSGGNAELKDDIAALQALGLQVVDGKICQAYKEE